MSRAYRNKVLVVAPQFPAINQPWIDTYLEQLLAQGLEPLIYSAVDKLGKYSSKVDALQLRQRIVPLSLSIASVIKGALGVSQAQSLCLITDISRRLSGGGMREFLSGILTSLYFVRAPLDEIHIIHSHDEILAYRFLYLASLRNVPIVLTFHGLPPAGIGQLSDRKRGLLYRSLAKVIVNTEFAKQQVCSLGCSPDKVIILPQGLPIGDFPFVSRLAPGAGARLKLLTVGRYHRDKGQAYALLALKRLLLKGISAEWTFVGVGPDLSRLKGLVEKLGLTNDVRFLVALPPEELKQLYQQSHLFVLPSVINPGGHIETQGVVLQEAQASGCIPIASNVGGIPECVNDGRDALLVKQKSSRDLVRKIEFLMMNPDRWNSFQQAGRFNVVENLSADVIGRKMAQLLVAQV